MNASVSNLIGRWDGESSGLGSFILFLSELIQLKQNLKASSLIVQINERFKDFVNISKAVQAIDLVESPYNEIACALAADYYWPPRNDSTHRYDTTKFLQHSYSENGLMLPLKFKENQIENVLSLMKLEKGQFSCVLHLKQHPKNIDSNAILEEWLKFLRNEKHANVMFFPIGNEYLAPEIFELENVNAVLIQKGNLLEQLVAVSCADVFMGMSTGPSNVAIVGSRPYVIFKHPEHHKLEMQEEIGDTQSFPFAQSNQFILRQYENAESLSMYLRKVLAING